jgi:hypothetical protein
MGEIRRAQPVKLIVGMLSAYPAAFAEAEARLADAFGPADTRSDLFAHEFTEYYRDEMGHPLARYFAAFRDLVAPGRLAEIKTQTNAMEAAVAAEGEWDVVRPVNLDPGYVDAAKLVLASTKDYAHRVALGGGIYAEVTLQYRDGDWTAFEWTYPDYRTPAYQEFFTRARQGLLAARREAGRG